MRPRHLSKLRQRSPGTRRIRAGPGFATVQDTCADLRPVYENAYGENYQANFSYGYNALGGGLNGRPQNLGLGRIVVRGGSPGVGLVTTELTVRDGEVVAPSEMIAIGDREGGDELCTPIFSPGSPGVRSGNDPTNCHRGRANLVFCDSHVEFALQTKWKEHSDAARRRWNNDHQPHAETW